LGTICFCDTGNTSKIFGSQSKENSLCKHLKLWPLICSKYSDYVVSANATLDSPWNSSLSAPTLPPLTRSVDSKNDLPTKCAILWATVA
jgi:hypothetical protein